MLVCGNAWGATYKLEKVSSVSAGNLYVFEQNGHVMNNEITNNALQTTTEYKTKGLDGTETYVWKLVSAGEDLFYLLNVSIELLLNNGSSTTVSFGSKLSKWSIAFTNGIALVSNTSNSDRFLGYTSSNSYAYKAYATSNLSSYSHAITMYQLVADDDNLPDVPVNPTITTEDMSCGVDEVFDVSQMFSSNSDGAITYSVEGANAEDYDLDGSEFLSEVARTYTIKASQAAVDGKYNAGEATATLTVLGRYTVNYYSLGVKIGTEEVNDGETIANVPEVTNAPVGWSFIGWTTDDAYVQSTTAPTFFEGVVTKDINLYAVFGKREGQISLTKMKTDDSLSDGDNIVIVAHVDKADESGIKDYALYQETIKSSFVNKYPFVEDAELIAADEKNWLTVNMKADGFSLGDKKNGYIYSVDNNLHCGETEQIWTISTTEDGHFHLQSDNRYLSYRYDLSTNNYWRMGGASLGTSGQTTLDIYKFVAGTFAYATTFAQSQDVTISNVGFATAYMGFDATVSGADAYYVTVSDDVASLTKVEGVIPANTGVVLEAQNGGAATATFTESVATADDKAAAEGNMLKGTLNPDGKTFNEQGHTYYALRNGEHGVCFYWDPDTQDEGASAKCACGKAVLDVPSTGSAPSSSIGIRFDGASLIENTDLNEEKCYHDFLGHKVEKPSTGLYIVNGKKILVK